MRYYCEICLKNIKKKSKHSNLKSKSHKEIEKYKNKNLSLKNVDINDVDEILYIYMKDHNRTFNHYLLKGQFILVFNDNQDCKIIITGMIDNRTILSWSNYLRDAINNLKEEGYDCKYITEMDNITLAHISDMTYDFYLKHNMPAVEWKLNQLINKNKNLINKLPITWMHLLNRKFESYRV